MTVIMNNLIAENLHKVVKKCVRRKYLDAILAAPFVNFEYIFPRYVVKISKHNCL